MASLQPRRSRGRTYWHIVESRRVDGKPRAVPIYYLGKADDLLARLRGQEALKIHSYSHGAVAALLAQAKDLGMAEVIDATLAQWGRRASGRDLAATQPIRPPVKNDGLSVGQSLQGPGYAPIIIATLDPSATAPARAGAWYRGNRSSGH
jgi:hypothetical protein